MHGLEIGVWDLESGIGEREKDEGRVGDG